MGIDWAFAILDQGSGLEHRVIVNGHAAVKLKLKLCGCLCMWVLIMCVWETRVCVYVLCLLVRERIIH